MNRMANEPSFQIFRMNKKLCSFSRNNKFLALADNTNLLIKNTIMYDNYLKFMFADVIEGIEWSPNSEYILCYSIKKAIIQIFSIYYPEWKFKLTAGSSGINNAIWTPDSNHIITIADLKVQLCIWNLINYSAIYIDNLKSSAINGVEFSPNGENLAIIVSNNGQDNIDIYKTKNWKLSRKLICNGLARVDGISWSPNSEMLSIWCALVGESKMIIYSTITENYEGIFSPDYNKIINIGKENIIANRLDKNLKGLEIIKWLHSGELLVASGYNEMVVLLNCLTWNPILQLRLEPVIKGNNYLTRVFKEYVIKEFRCSNELLKKMPVSKNKHILEEVYERPVNVPVCKNEVLMRENLSKSTIHIIDIMEFSSCGQYLAVRHRIYPRTLWIWDIKVNSTDIIILQNNISEIKWNPVQTQLLIFNISAYMYEWNPKEVLCLNVPRGIAALDGRWHSLSNTVLLCSYNRAIIYRFNTNKKS